MSSQKKTLKKINSFIVRNLEDNLDIIPSEHFIIYNIYDIESNLNFSDFDIDFINEYLESIKNLFSFKYINHNYNLYYEKIDFSLIKRLINMFNSIDKFINISGTEEEEIPDYIKLKNDIFKKIKNYICFSLYIKCN